MNEKGSKPAVNTTKTAKQITTSTVTITTSASTSSKSGAPIPNSSIVNINDIKFVASKNNNVFNAAKMNASSLNLDENNPANVKSSSSNISVMTKSVILRTKVGATLPPMLIRRDSDCDLSDPRKVVELDNKDKSNEERKVCVPLRSICSK